MDDKNKHIWSDIYERGPEDCSVFRENWYQAWSDQNSDVNYAEFSDQENRHVIFPYFIKKMGPFDFASLAGNYFPRKGLPYCGTSDELVSSMADFMETLPAISGFQLGPVKKDDPFIKKLVKKLATDGWNLMLTSTGFDHGMAVPDTVDEYMGSISKSRRKKTAYYLRRLEKNADVEIKHHKSMDATAWQSVFKDLETVESRAWVSEKGDPHFIGIDRQSYWKALVQDEWYQDAMNAWIIYADERPVSYTVALDIGQERFVLSSSFDKEYADFRTGSILEIEMMRSTIEQGKVNFMNNGMGDSGYKGAWGNKEFQELYEIVAFPPTLKGKITYLIALLKKKFGR